MPASSSRGSRGQRQSGTCPVGDDKRRRVGRRGHRRSCAPLRVPFPARSRRARACARECWRTGLASPGGERVRVAAETQQSRRRIGRLRPHRWRCLLARRRAPRQQSPARRRPCDDSRYPGFAARSARRSQVAVVCRDSVWIEFGDDAACDVGERVGCCEGVALRAQMRMRLPSVRLLLLRSFKVS